MKRRAFLQTTGMAIAGGSLALAGEKPAPEAAGVAASRNILITSAHSSLAQTLAAGLGESYRVHLTSRVEVATKLPFTRCDFSEPATTAGLVRGMTAIVHVGEPVQGMSGAAMLDERTRGTYNLLQGATGEGVRNIVHLSSLEVMLGYEEEYLVTEDWAPRPTPGPDALSRWLGEFTCREFAREENARICVLRLGRIVESQDPVKSPQAALRLEQADAVQAVSRALSALVSERSKLGRWSVFHVVSDVRNARFPAARASQILGYHPQSAG